MAFRQVLMKLLRESPLSDLDEACALQVFMRCCEDESFESEWLSPFRQDFMNSLRVSPVLPVASLLQVVMRSCWAVLGLDMAAPPVDGKANAELVALVAREFGCTRSAVEIATGAGARIKRVRIAG